MRWFGLIARAESTLQGRDTVILRIEVSDEATGATRRGVYAPRQGMVHPPCISQARCGQSTPASEN